MSDLSSAIRNICEEKNLSYEAVVTTIESALAAAYRKDFGQKNQNIKVEFDPETGKSKVFDVKTVVEDMPAVDETADEGEKEDKKTKESGFEGKEKLKIKSEKSKANDKTENKGEKEDLSSGLEKIKKQEEGLSSEALAEEEERKFNPKTEIQLSDAKLIKKTAKIGGEIKIKLEVPADYGRMAAQTAKQVIIQRLREAEREMIFSEFKGKEKEVVSGVIQRREGRMVLVDLGKAIGYLPAEEQIYGENYNSGERTKVYIKEVRLGPKGAEVVLSRTSDEILKKVFYLEIPEISNGLVELKAVAREAGSRSKVAVATDSENVDPIGSCVGQRGARIQTIISELGGEKVDIILYDEDSAKFIANALSPAKISGININEKEKKATVKVAADQLSLAIGKSGQNARLAARLTGWRIDIIEDKSKKAEEEKRVEPTVKEDKAGKSKRNEKVDKPEEEQKNTKTPSSTKATEGESKQENNENTLKDAKKMQKKEKGEKPVESGEKRKDEKGEKKEAAKKKKLKTENKEVGEKENKEGGKSDSRGETGETNEIKDEKK